MDAFNLGKPIAGGGSSGLVGHTVPLNGFDQGEHGAGTGVSGGHVPSASNQARGYGQDDSSHSTGASRTPIADKFTSGHSHEGHSHSHSHAPSGEAVSGSYAGGGTRDALTGESNAHTTGAGVGKLAENLGHSGHSHSHEHSSGHNSSSAVGYGGSINRTAESGHHTGSARDAALTATAGAAAASALAPATGSHGHSTGTGVGAAGGSGGHYSTSSEHGSTGHSGQNLNIGTGASAGVLAGQQAGAKGTHGDSGISGSHHGSSAAGAAGVGAAASHGHKSNSSQSESNERGTPLSNPKDLDSGSRHGLVFNESTGKYVHRHELEEK